MSECHVPPPGWVCTREAGHGPPCAAWPVPIHRGSAEPDPKPSFVNDALATENAALRAGIAAMHRRAQENEGAAHREAKLRAGYERELARQVAIRRSANEKRRWWAQKYEQLLEHFLEVERVHQAASRDIAKPSTWQRFKAWWESQP